MKCPKRDEERQGGRRKCVGGKVWLEKLESWDGFWKGIEVCENMSWNFQVQSKSTDSVSCDKMIYFRIDVKTKVIFVVVVGFFCFFFFFSCVCYCFGLCSTTVQNRHQSCRPEAACSKLNPFVGQSNAKQRDPQHRQGIFLPAQRIFTIPPAPRIPSAFPLHPSQDFGKWSCSPVITCYLRPALLQRCHPIC